MAIRNIPGFITHTSYPWTDSGEETISFFATTHDVFANNEYTVAVRAHTFAVEVPDNFDPIPHKIAGMKAKIGKIKAAAFDEVKNLEGEIQKLMSIAYEAPAADSPLYTETVVEDAALMAMAADVADHNYDIPF